MLIFLAHLIFLKYVVLDYAIRLIEVGDESSLVSSLVVFSVQYVLVNHEHWKYKMKSDRWKVTLKVLVFFSHADSL